MMAPPNGARARRAGWHRLRSALAGILSIVGGVLVAVALVEGGTAAFLGRPGLAQHLPQPVLNHLRDVYMQIDRAVPQLQAETARYDPRLTYTLRPGNFVFAAREFTTHYSVNSLGVRDDEASLHEPEIVVLGDSYAMGWGVEQDEAFPQVIERRTGKRVLNAAVASYGTVREMWMLDRIDLSRASNLIVQYCSNDMPENVELMEKGTLDIMPEPIYDNLVAGEPARRRYWFGRYAVRLVERSLGVSIAGAADDPSEIEAEAFVNALAHASRQPLDGIQLTVVSFSIERQGFPQRLAALLRKRGDLPAGIREMKILRPLDRPQGDWGFVFDDHWNARGHAALADMVLDALANLGGGR